MNIIGISGLHNSVAFKKKRFPNLSAREYKITQGFDSAAALINNEGVMAAVAEERFTREKATGSFPINAIQYCLKAANINPNEIDCIAHGFYYESSKSFYQKSEYTQQQFQEVYSHQAQLRTLSQFLPGYNWEDKFIGVPHHLAHAASSYYVSGLSSALILVTDGIGEQHSSTIALGKGNKIEVIQQIASLNSLGIFYGVFTLYLGFVMGMDEYKVMGLAPYGDSKRYFSRIMNLISLKDDGTYTIPILFQNTTEEEKETYRGTLNQLSEMFGAPRKSKSEITQHHIDIAAALQAVVQGILMHVLRHYKKETGETNLCLAGGVGLNCTANGVIKRSRMFKNIFIQPAAGDDGTALGAALYIQRTRQPEIPSRKMKLPLWGPGWTDKEIQSTLQDRIECDSTYFESFEDLAQEIASLIAKGNIVAWFQGRMEYGPRALGNRSILADPRDPEMRNRLNQLIKKREGFRPFAPAVLAEKAAEFFEVKPGDTQLYEHMLCVTQVQKKYRDKLPAVTHVNGSARVQTVSKTENQKFWNLINEFGQITGIPVLVNTSFNVKGQPIVCTPKEAIETFLFAKLNVLVLGNYLVVRKVNQPATKRQEEKAKELEAMIEAN